AIIISAPGRGSQVPLLGGDVALGTAPRPNIMSGPGRIFHRRIRPGPGDSLIAPGARIPITWTSSKAQPEESCIRKCFHGLARKDQKPRSRFVGLRGHYRFTLPLPHT